MDLFKCDAKINEIGERVLESKKPIISNSKFNEYFNIKKTNNTI